jgi:hypothetical protein
MLNPLSEWCSPRSLCQNWVLLVDFTENFLVHHEVQLVHTAFLDILCSFLTYLISEIVLVLLGQLKLNGRPILHVVIELELLNILKLVVTVFLLFVGVL